MEEQYKTIQDIYDAYDVMPQLREHMIRVAAVGGFLARTSNLSETNVKDIELALLLHDIANIIKFDLDRFPVGVEAQGLQHWKNIQCRYINTYGTDEDEAHQLIALEISVTSNIIDYMKMVGFAHVCDLARDGSIERQICEYADLRVAPHGIVSLQERLEDGKARYGISDADERWDVRKCATALEKVVCTSADCSAKDITTDILQEEIDRLSNARVGYRGGCLTMI